MNSKKIDKEKKSEFPKLMVSNTNLILALNSKNNGEELIGVMLWSLYNTPIGYYCEYFDADKFHDYPGQVILSNHKIDEKKKS